VHYLRSNCLFVVENGEQLKIALELFKGVVESGNERLCALFEKRTKLPREQIMEIFRFGEIHKNFLSATQAVDLGFADEVVSDFKLFPRKKEEQKP
jgi:hypothetical protein